MEGARRPIYLFADSQMLFWKNRAGLFLQSLRRGVAHSSPIAAYIGAANGDVPEFYEIFESAMRAIDILDCKWIRSSFGVDDESFLEKADVILLSGGDVERGWNALMETRMAELVKRKYYEGATLIGVSAGAVQLGLYAYIRQSESALRLIDTFKLVPFLVGVHSEHDEWHDLVTVVRMLEGAVKGVGIPRAGGLVCHPDDTVEAVRWPVHEFSMAEGRLLNSLLLPA